MGLYTTTEPRCIDLFEFIHNQDAETIVFTIANVPKFVICTHKHYVARPKAALASVQSSAPTRDLIERIVELSVARASREAVHQSQRKSTAWDWQTVRREALEAAVREFGATT